MGLFNSSEESYQRIFQKGCQIINSHNENEEQPWADIIQSTINTIMFYCFVGAIELVNEFPQDITVPLKAKQFAPYLKRRFEETYDDSIPKGDIEDAVDSYLSSYLLALKTGRSKGEDVIKEMIGRYLKSCDIDNNGDYIEAIYNEMI